MDRLFTNKMNAAVGATFNFLTCVIFCSSDGILACRTQIKDALYILTVVSQHISALSRYVNKSMSKPEKCKTQRKTPYYLFTCHVSHFQMFSGDVCFTFVFCEEAPVASVLIN